MSRLETFDDGRYSLGLTGGSASQSGTFRVLGTRRPTTNTLSIDVVGSNTVSVSWYKDGVAVSALPRGGRNLIPTTESLGNPPVTGGVNTRFKLTIGDVVPADAGKYWAVVDNFVRNPDTAFGQPSVLLTSSSTSRVATVTIRGYAAGEAPEIVSAAVFGGPSSNSTDEATALAALPGNQVLLATKSTTFGAGGNQQASVSIRSAGGEALWNADQRSEALGGGTIGTIKALVPDGDGGAFIAGDGASGTQDPWFLRRIRPAVIVANGVTNRTFTNLWTARVTGPFTNGIDNLRVPRGADVVGIIRSGDGVLVAGHFSGKTRFGFINVVTNALIPQFTAQVGGVTLTNAFDAAFDRNDSSKDLYLAKYDALGQLQWIRQYGGTNAETLTTLTVDPNGNILLAGSFKTRTTFGSTTVESTRSLPANGIPFYAADGFVSKLDSTGQPLWIRTIGGIRESSISDTVVASAVVDAKGEVTFFANRVAGQAFIHPGVMVSPHYLGRLNAAGELLWTQEFTSQGNAQLTLDQNSNILFVDSVFGSNLTNSASFGAGQLTIPPWAGSVAASFSLSGSLLWFRALDEKLQFVDDARTVTPQKIALDPEGGLVIAGRLPGGSNSGLGRSSGQRLDRFEFATEASANANPTDLVLFKLAAAYTPSVPKLIREPVSQSALLQDRVVLEGLAEGYPTPQYQWLLDGKPIAGATSRVLILPDLARTNRGTYTLVASNSIGVATSTPVALTPRPRPTMTGWTLVTSATNYLGNALRVSADDAGNFQLLHNELSRGSSVYLEGFRPDGTWAWRFQETVTGTFPVQNTVYTIQSRIAPLTLGSGEIFIAGKAQINRLQGAGSNRNFLGRLNPADGSPLWMLNDLGAVGSSIAALDIQDSVIRVLLNDRTFHRIGFDGKVQAVTTVSNVPSTVAEAYSRTALDRDGGYYFYGNRIEALNLGTTNLPALGTSGAQTFILAKYNPSGVLDWFQTHSGQGVGAVEPFTLLVAPDGDAILASRPAAGSGANIRFQIGTNLLSGYSIVARFSPAGAVRWAKSWWLKVDDAVLAPDGNVVLGGWFRIDPTAAPGNKQLSFGTNRVAAASTYDVFVASLDASGNERYIRQSGSPSFAAFDNARDATVAVNRSGTVWLGGFSQLPPSSAALDFGDLRYTWPDLKAYNIGNLFGDLSTFFVARLDAETVAPTVAEITFAPPAPGSSILKLSWPAGFRLQHRETLYSGDWTTLDVTPPYDANIKAATQGYFRVIRAGQ